MLIELRVANHRSVRDEQALTMEAGRVGDPRDSRPRQVAGHAKPLLPVAALYGANASGKSNVVSAAAFLRDAVVDSHRKWEPDGGIPREPFAWGAHSAEPSLFEVTFLLEGVRYQYGFVATDEEFIEEWLYAWPQGRKQVWYERDRDSYRFGEHLRGENRVVEDVTRPNALFLSAAAQHRHEQLTSVYSWFQTFRVEGVGGRRRGGRLELPPDRWIAHVLSRGGNGIQPSLSAGDSDQDAESLLALLRAADVGIVEMKVEDDDKEDATSPVRRHRRPRILLRHKSSNSNAWLPFDEESQGTQTLLRMAPVVIDALLRGGVLIIDELEASLHPLLALHLIRQFNDPAKNPNNAQLVFTTHDTNLLGTTLGEPALRRDQIWLTEKDDEGATKLYPLTDYKPRKAENLERGYLQGRYGAIPFLGELARVGD